MPQMKPLNWLMLFLLFSLILFMKIYLNFYNIYKFNLNYKMQKNQTNKLTNNPWKW